MTLATGRALAFSALLVASAVGCAKSSFIGNTAAPGNGAKLTGPGGSGNNPTGTPTPQVSVPVGGNQPVPGITPNAGTKCLSTDPNIATVDPNTCVVTGKSPGQTSIVATLPNGTKDVVPTTVTPNGQGTAGGTAGGTTSGVPSLGTGGGSGSNPTLSTDGTQTAAVSGGTLTSSDGVVTNASGFLCLGGPYCNVSYLLKSQTDAQTCMNVANPLPCANDPKCGPQFLLQVCNCNCTNSAGLNFDDPSTCRRNNPEKGVVGGHPECTKQ